MPFFRHCFAVVFDISITLEIQSVDLNGKAKQIYSFNGVIVPSLILSSFTNGDEIRIHIYNN